MSDILFLEPVGGIAGDMFLAACIDLGVSREALVRELEKLGPLGFHLVAGEAPDQIIGGIHVDVHVHGHHHHGDHHHHHHPHDHRAYRDIVKMIDASNLSPRVKEAALSVFRVIGEAEARVHRKSLEEIHFHEVGAVDSIVDVVGAAICLEQLGWPRVLASAPPAGSGTVKTAHGPLPVPPPATLEILKGRRMRPSGPGERTTPTGAGILAALTEEVEGMPDLVIDRTGYGVGTMRFEDAPNILRAVLGRQPAGHLAARECVLVEANLDDASGQLLARAVDAVLAAGALDAWVLPAVGKKGRPLHVLSVLVEDSAREKVERLILTETTTLGLRRTRCDRHVLDREWREVETPWGLVRVKLGRLDGEIVNVAPEHDDCLRVAEAAGVPLKRVLQTALARALEWSDGR